MPIVGSFKQSTDSDLIFSCPAKQEKSSAKLGKKLPRPKKSRNQQEIKESRPLTTNFLSLLMCVKSDAGEFREHAP